MKAVIVDNFTSIWDSASTSRAWKMANIKLLYKGVAARTKLSNFRPTNITLVLYRMCLQVLRGRLQRRVEQTGFLGKLQNGFRTGKRMEDSLSVPIQAIELVRQEDRQPFTAYLGISKAHETVDLRLLRSPS